MPSIKVPEPTLLSLIKVDWIINCSDEDREKAVGQAVFHYGIELEGVEDLIERHSDVAVRHFKFDVPANRPDLCCAEGIAIALNIFHGAATMDDYAVRALPSTTTVTLKASAETSALRPHARGAVLRQMALTNAVYNSFIDFQDKLHHNACRRRRLVAIGTHDMSKMAGPISYGLEAPESIRFVPLNHEDERDGNGVLDEYRADPALADFVPILDGQPLFPVYRDGEGVLSMPPLINSDRTKMTVTDAPVDIFIDISATDSRRADTVLQTIVACFAQHCTGEFKNTYEPVTIVRETTGDKMVVPDMSEQVMICPKAEVHRITGLHLPAQELQALLARMNIHATENGDELVCRIPKIRSDVLHAVDVAEDVAIAYGLANLPCSGLPAATVGTLLPRSRVCEHVRVACAAMGLTEVCNFALSPPSDAVYSVLEAPNPANMAVVSNAKFDDYSAIRTGLVGGLLRVAALNNAETRPLAIFEVGEVLSVAPAVGRESVPALCETTARCGILMSADPAPFSEVHGMLDSLMFGLDRTFSLCPDTEAPAPFMPGRSAAVVAKGKVVGRIGLIHPRVLADFKITWPIAYVEIEL